MTKLKVIDSHTGGEPTRVIVSGMPDLGSGTIQQRLDRFRSDFDHIRSATVHEPRGNDAIVGALLCEPHDPTCQFGVIFFNNVGFLNMCGHGTIGLMVTLAHMGRVGKGVTRIDTNCGPVDARLNDDGSVTLRNVPSYRSSAAVPVEVPGIGTVKGDIAWGGNWFFLISDHGQELSLARLDELTDYTWRVRRALEANQITGADGREIDHIELFGPGQAPGADSRTLCSVPGKRTTVRPAAPAPAPSWRASTPTANSSRARYGARRASSAASSAAPWFSKATSSTPKSRAKRTSTPRPI